MRLNDEVARDVDDWTVDNAEVILRTHGCRATGPRIAVLRALLRHGGPIDAAALTKLAHGNWLRVLRRRSKVTAVSRSSLLM